MSPAHRSGEAIRCAGRGNVMQLHDIIAPEPAAPCAGYSGCSPDPGAAARDHLAELTRGQKPVCRYTGGITALDNPPRRIVRCSIDDVDLSCRMVADGFAIGNDASKACAAEITRKRAVAPAPRPPVKLPLALLPLLLLYLVVINIVAYFVFAADHRRAITRINRISETELLGVIAFGGGAGALVAQQRFDHMIDQQPFASQMAVLIGLQIGAVLAIAGMVIFRL